jgi:hypothetical protein
VHPNIVETANGAAAKSLNPIVVSLRKQASNGIHYPKLSMVVRVVLDVHDVHVVAEVG